MKSYWFSLACFLFLWVSGWSVIVGTPAQYYASNASSPLPIPAYVQYLGINEIVHPDVVEIPNGWHGYRYWMAFTPFPNSDAIYENPSIAVSNDNSNWIVPPGLTNPVDAYNSSASDYASDPDLLLSPDGQTMYLFWRRYKINAFEKIYVMSTTDGINWTNKTEIISVAPTAETLISPSVVHNGQHFMMWTVDKHLAYPALRKVMLRTSNSPFGPWSAPTATDIGALTVDAIQNPVSETWHINVLYQAQTYWMINNDSSSSSSSNSLNLYLGNSSNGINWSFATHPVLSRRDPAGNWDRSLYRACILPLPNSQQQGFKLWYSVRRRSDSSPWRIGYTEIWCAPKNVRLEQTASTTQLKWDGFATVYNTTSYFTTRYLVQETSTPAVESSWTNSSTWMTNLTWTLPAFQTRKFYRVKAKIE